TTLAKILCGYEKVQEGKVLIDGYNKKKGYNPVQLIFQYPEKAVNPKWKMRKILEEAFKLSKNLLYKIGIKKEWLNR
ncbi:MAG: ABC transporter ATP-binding protein, partial [Paraclostridium sp.]